MPVVRRSATLSATEAAAALAPWHGVVSEVASASTAGCPTGTKNLHRFEVDTGPVHHWQRTVLTEERPDGRVKVTQTVDYRLDLPLFAWLFTWPVQREATRLPLRPTTPWWAPPRALDRAGGRTLCALAVVALVTGYLGTLITQTLTFVGGELGLDTTGQASLLALVRIDVVIAFCWSALADRWGRRTTMLWGLVGAVTATLISGAAPNLAVYTASQIVARGLTAATAIVFAVAAAEELPAKSRGWGASLLAITAAFGSGNCVLSLKLADLAPWGWRLSYAAPLIYVPLLVVAFGSLSESRRFDRSAHLGSNTDAADTAANNTDAADTAANNTDAANNTADNTGTDAPRPLPDRPGGLDRYTQLRSVAGRLGMLSLSLGLVSMYSTPINQLQNDFLRTRWGYSGGMIAAFSLVTGTPMGLGVAIGGKLSDMVGRRLIGAVGLASGAVGTTVSYLSPVEWGMWTARLTGNVLAALAVPALAVYGPELFPTRMRGTANGVITGFSRAGAVLGLLLAGLLVRRLGGFGPAAAALGAGPLLAAAMVLFLYPETAGLELEELNPSDRAPSN